MVSRLFFILLFLTTPLVGGTTHPATTRGAAHETIDLREEEAQFAAETSKLPPLSAKSPGDVLRFSIGEQMLIVNLVKGIRPGEFHVTLPRADVVASLRKFQTPPGDLEDSRGFMFILRDFSNPNGVSVWTTVSTTVGRTQIDRDFESDGESGSVQLMQDPPPPSADAAAAPDPVRFTVRRISEKQDGKDIDLKLSAPSFVELRRRYPAETDRYLRPVLNDLGQESLLAPDAASAWQTLADDWKPTAELTAQVNQLIAQTGADEFSQRRAALRSLQSLGEPAALLLMRTDRGKLSAAQNAAIDTFLAPFLPLSANEAKRSGRDPIFLLDVQYCDDANVRTLAAARLTAILGKPLLFDPASPASQRLGGVEEMRSALTAPSTQQAK
ncbi:MAG: hypothetical protein JO353_01160 [Phycisphaerae bacterium]|nr:hypothetical protein [Phycisphaerae bacterium]